MPALWGKYDGPFTAALAAALQDIHGVPYVLPCCSGTLAVELALRAVGVRRDDEVILAGYDFPGNFRAIEAVGASARPGRHRSVDLVPGCATSGRPATVSGSPLVGPQTRADRLPSARRPR